MRAILLAYVMVFVMYLGIACGVSFFAGAWETNLITAGAIATLMSALDGWQRYRALKENRAKLEQYKKMLASMGIDFDQLLKQRGEAQAKAEAERAANSN